jgi:hypothetical protein
MANVRNASSGSAPKRTTTKTTSTNTPKKTVTRKSPKKLTPVDQTVDMSAPMSIEEAPQTRPGKVKISRKSVLTVVAILLIAGLLYYVKGWFVAAVVNGEPISRFQVIRELEARGGKQVLDNDVYMKLVYQEAAKKHVSVTQKEKDDWFKQSESDYAKQGKNLNDLLTQAHFTKSDYIEQSFTVNKLLEKMVAGQVKDPTDQEIADYITKNKEQLPTDKSDKDMKSYVKEGLRQMALNDKIQTLQQELEKNAKVTYWVNY